MIKLELITNACFDANPSLLCHSSLLGPSLRSLQPFCRIAETRAQTARLQIDGHSRISAVFSCLNQASTAKEVNGPRFDHRALQKTAI
jgi:hypothetical protein